MKINITEHFGKGEINAFPGGVIKVTRDGTMERNGVDLTPPTMDETATVYLARSSTGLGDTPITTDASGFRWLSRFFDSCAKRMDEGLDVPERTPHYEPILLVDDPESGDTFFTGDLDAARVLVEKDRRIDVRAHVGSYTVHLIDDPDNDDSVAEWGSAASEESAMRFAFGAYFGPTDAEYDEHRLLRALAAGSWHGTDEMPLLPDRSVEQIEAVLRPDPWAVAQEKSLDIDEDLAPMGYCNNDLHLNGDGREVAHVQNPGCTDWWSN